MNAIVIENVKVEELPEAWRARLTSPADATVTVRIEEEASNQATTASRALSEAADNPLFGMWADREDMADVPAYIRAIRASRFNRDGTRSDQAGPNTGAQE